MDAALPRFTIAESSNHVKHHNSIFIRRPHSEPEPAYSIHRADPSSASSKNCYAAGIVDAYNEQVLFGEVMIEPKWTFPTLSADAIRQNGGIAPPPEPLQPTEFTIQLYNPDQQVKITQKQSSIVGSSRWEFSMPMEVFRLPSASALDRAQDDPIASETTPKVNFSWRKESKFSKELVCYVTGKSTDLNHKKKSKEPDIAVAMFKSLRDITIYEPNLCRIELEDPKGLEVVLLLGAVVIKDVFFGKDPRSVFNISRLPSRDPATGRRISSPSADRPSLSGAGAAAMGLYGPPRPPAHTQVSAGQSLEPVLRQSTGPPRLNPRTQWEIDAETRRLEGEERARRKEEERVRRERERAADEETKRLRRMVEAEERQRQEQDRAVEQETKRLQKLFGVQPPAAVPPVMSGANGPPPLSYPAPNTQGPFPPPQNQSYQNFQNQPIYPSTNGYMSYPSTQQPPPQNYTYQPNPHYQQQFNYPPQHLQTPSQPPDTRPGRSSREDGRRRRDVDDPLRRKRSAVF